MACGYRAETLTSLENCTHFKRTHLFLIQVWEALYSEMIRAFTTTRPHYSHIDTKLQHLLSEHTTESSTIELLLAVQQLVSETSTITKFDDFVAVQSEDDTWKLWLNFVLIDCFCYVSLFLSIRTSNWEQRMYSLKCMAPLFAAYDRPCYQKLLPRHIADLQVYPEVIDCL